MKNFKKVDVLDGYVFANFDTKKVIRIKNDSNLKSLTFYHVAEACKKEYKNIHGKNIDIRTNSFALEIAGHVFPDDLFSAIKKIPYLPKFIKDFINNNILVHTDVIDCGEASVDSNRIVWDWLTGEAYEKIKQFIK